MKNGLRKRTCDFLSIAYLDAASEQCIRIYAKNALEEMIFEGAFF